jgi:hypothetical protein
MLHINIISLGLMNRFNTAHRNVFMKEQLCQGWNKMELLTEQQILVYQLASAYVTVETQLNQYLKLQLKL